MDFDEIVTRILLVTCLVFMVTAVAGFVWITIAMITGSL